MSGSSCCQFPTAAIFFLREIFFSSHATCGPGTSYLQVPPADRFSLLAGSSWCQVPPTDRFLLLVGSSYWQVPPGDRFLLLADSSSCYVGSFCCLVPSSAWLLLLPGSFYCQITVWVGFLLPPVCNPRLSMLLDCNREQVGPNCTLGQLAQTDCQQTGL
jgi:hypothetical protein